MAFKVVLLLLLAGLTPDQYEIARMLDGEAVACVGDFCHDAATFLIDTVYNRLDAGWCESIETCLNEGYWGYHDAPLIPGNWAIEAARDYQRQNHDILFAFSDKDRIGLGLDRNTALAIAGPFHFYDNSIDLGGKSP
jgi:hypothetical protein